VLGLDQRQRRTLVWAGLAVVLTAFDGSVLVLALPAISRDFNANTPALSDLGSVLALGSLGALPLSTLADRFGRRRLIAVGVAGFSLANLASGFATSLAMLAVLRLIAVGFEILVGSVATALFVEEAPAALRGRAVSVLALLSGLGAGITVVAYPLLAPHWRWLFLAGGAGALLAPFIWFRLPEGSTWLRVHATASALRLLFDPPWRRRILLFAAVTVLASVLFEPAGLFYTLFASATLHLSPRGISTLIVVSGVSGATAYLAGGFLTDRLGRRGPAIALTLATVVAASLSFATGTAGFLAGNVLWSVFSSASTPVYGAWSAELFPTRARASAEASLAVAGAVGSIAGLQLVGLLAQRAGLGGAIAWSGLAAVAGVMLLFGVPETKQAPLPE
jgi:SHS family lactate transporter-like MFS transporter